MKSSVRSLSVSLLVVGVFAAGLLLRPVLFHAATPPAASEQGETLWTCGMHPDVIRDKPGQCPQCGMALTPISAGGKGREGKGERKIAYWWDPMMSPPYISDRPGKSPMGMDLVPKYQDEIAGGALIEIDPVVVQNMGIRLARVEEGRLETTIRMVGYFRESQPLQHDVTLKLGGFVERLHADTVGMEIPAGAPLFELYSPDLLVAQEELLATRRALDRLPSDASETVRREAAEILETARRKLFLWDVSEEEIRRIEALPRADGRGTFHARFGGILAEKEVVVGSSVMAGMRLLRIVDYSTLWLDAQAYEYQLSSLRLGQKGRARVEAFPGETFEGEAIFLSPSLEERTRTATVRLAFPNGELRLRPGMYARVEISALVAERALRAPREAILDTGVRQVAFVSLGGGKFEPRTVRMGASGDEGIVQVLEGLAPGEEVVASGQFLLDSESRLREAARKFLEARAGRASATQPATQPSGEAVPPARGGEVPETKPTGSETRGADLEGETRRRVDGVLLPYLKLVDSLAADKPDSTLAAAIRRAAEHLAADPSPEVSSIGKRLVEQAAAMTEARGNDERKKFAALSETVVRLVDLVAPSKAVGSTLFVLRCPMFPGSGSWLQPSREVTNPLFGTSMLHCGEVLRAIVPVGGEPAEAPSTAPAHPAVPR